MLNILPVIKSKALVFWDFDGVIKDSLDIKSAAYESIFMVYGNVIASRVRTHHEANGGISRFDKIPLYLEWAGESVTQSLVEEFCKKFSQAVVQSVINSPWVPGVQEYLLEYCMDQYFFLITATPQDEIEQILASLALINCFREIFGAPTPKKQAIKSVLDKFNCSPDKALVIGDSETDRLAAQGNSVPFLLRRTAINLRLQQAFCGPVFDGLNYE